MNENEMDDIVELLSEMKTEVKIGHMQLRKGSCRTYVYRKNEVSEDKILPSEECITTSEIIEDSPIFYNKKIIGRIKDAIYDTPSGSLNIISILDKDDKDYSFIEEHQDQFLILPHIETSRVGCIICNNYYEVGQTPCNCIHAAPYLILSSMKIIGMTLFDGMNDNINDVIDNRQQLLRSFFGGAMASLLLHEPI
jgi:hypothetical protein